MKQTANRSLVALLIAAWAATVPLPAAADEKAPDSSANAKPAENQPAPSRTGKRETYPFRGVIGSVDLTARTVTLNGRTNRRVIAVIPETRLTRDGEPAAMDDLKSGEAVGGTLRKTSDGKEEALLIRIGAKPEKDDPKARASGKGQKASKSEALPP